MNNNLKFDDFRDGTVTGGVVGGGKGLYSRALWPGPEPDIPPTGQVWKVYYYVAAQMIAMREISGITQASTLYYLHSDHLGSTSLATNASGGVVSRQSYYAYGTPRNQQGTLHSIINASIKGNYWMNRLVVVTVLGLAVTWVTWRYGALTWFALFANAASLLCVVVGITTAILSRLKWFQRNVAGDLLVNLLYLGTGLVATQSVIGQVAMSRLETFMVFATLQVATSRVANLLWIYTTPARR